MVLRLVCINIQMINEKSYQWIEKLWGENMKSLMIIQRTLKVLKTLSRIAMIVSFIVVGSALLGALCVIEWQLEGTLGIGRSIVELVGIMNWKQAICELLSDAVFAFTSDFLHLFAWSYLKLEQDEGTPFTYNGANKMRSLGIKVVVMLLVAVIISAVIYGCFKVEKPVDHNNAISVVLGIVLILISLVFRYGAELEMKALKLNRFEENC